MNHRYPNHNYQTITRKYGRKLSKAGYPYVIKLADQQPMLLYIYIGIKEDYITLIFPLQTFLTKENPVCKLDMRYYFDDVRFYFKTYQKDKHGLLPICWYSNEEDRENGKWPEESKRTLQPPKKTDNNRMLIYGDIITPCSLPVTSFLP